MFVFPEPAADASDSASFNEQLLARMQSSADDPESTLVESEAPQSSRESSREKRRDGKRQSSESAEELRELSGEFAKRRSPGQVRSGHARNRESLSASPSSVASDDSLMNRGAGVVRSVSGRMTALTRYRGNLAPSSTRPHGGSSLYALNDSDGEEDATPPASSFPDLKALSQASRNVRLEAKVRSGAARPTARTAWSDHDTILLIEAIRDDGANWAYLGRKLGPLLQLPRPAQALRDKARNMKVDFLT